MTLRDKLKFWLLLSSYVEMIVRGTSPLSLPDAIADSLEYLKAFGGTEQRNIPAEYTQVNYVTNTAQTLVDTGVKIDFSKNYEIELKVRGVTDSWYILQARESSGAPVSGISGSSSGNRISLSFNGSNVVASQIYRIDGHIYYVKGTVNNGNLTLYVKDETGGDEETVTGTYTPTTGKSVNIGLFGNLAGNYVAINSDVYFARIKEGGVAVMDYVPCRQSATAGFYDKVSGTFKTASNLVADGNTVPTPDTPMDIVSNNGVLKVRHQSGLPWGYTLLDYIESTGTQYIDTGIVPTVTNETEIRLNFARTQFIENEGFGSNSNLNIVAPAQSSPYWRANAVITSVPIVDNEFIDAVLKQTSNGRYYKIKTEEGYGTLSAINNPFLLGALGGNINYAYYGKYKSCIILENGILVRNFVPAKRNSDNVLGMYDLVNDVFYTNQGTGTFTAGSPVSDPVEIYTDGTVETINAHGKNLFDGQWRVGIYSTSTGAYTSNAGNRVCNTNMIQVKPSTTYTVSCPDYALAGGMRWLFYDENKNFIRATAGATTATTPSNAKYINFYIANDLTVATAPDLQLEQGSTATAYEPYQAYTATAEMLLKVGDYQDVQSILDGVVTRKVGIKVLDGTETWNVATSVHDGVNRNNFYMVFDDAVATGTDTVACSIASWAQTVVSAYSAPVCRISNTKNFNIVPFEDTTTIPNVTTWKQFLADQYNAGTPVIVVYPLATPTTESVAGQTLNIQQGDNFVEITQASLDNLEIEAKYKKQA